MRDPDIAIVVACGQHPARPDRDLAGKITCIQCQDAAVINESNPRWREAAYVPVRTWFARDAFRNVSDPRRGLLTRWAWRPVQRVLARTSIRKHAG